MTFKHLEPDGWRRMIHSRDIAELLPTVRSMCVHLIRECAAKDIDLVLTSTYRDPEAQARLWRHGRDGNADRFLTHNPPGWSWHAERAAFDVVPIYCGKPISTRLCELWELELWEQIGEIAENAVGLVWGGRIAGPARELEHFQHTFGREMDDLKMRGATLPETVDGHVVRFGANGSGNGWRSRVRAWVPDRVAEFFTNGREH